MLKKLIITTQDKLEKMIKERLEKASLEASRNYERNLLMKQADIASLQSQINPHFLYNTLECIRGQALLEGADDIAETTKALSRFFRYSISGKNGVALIRDEIENIKNYVTIQQYRFRGRFTLNINAGNEEGILDAVIPKLSLQPVLENAIIHGFSDITEGGIIDISIRKTGRNVIIEVSDNGKGMDPEMLDSLCTKIRNSNSLANDNTGPHTGIGLENVDRRIKLFFGSEYGLSVNSCPKVGTDVELFIPYMLSVNWL